MKEFNNRKVDELIDAHNSLKSKRQIKETTYSRIKSYFDPHGTSFPNYITPDGVEVAMPDSSVPRVTARNMIGYLFAYINPTNGDWVKAKMYDPAYEDDENIQEMLDVLTRSAVSMLAQSNYYDEVTCFLSDFVLYGKGILTVDVNEYGNGVSFTHIPLAQCYVDEAGTTLHREYALTPKEILNLLNNRPKSSTIDIPKWLEEEVAKENKKADSVSSHKIAYMVRPEPYKLMNKEFKFCGYLVDLDKRELLATDVFDKFPYVITDFFRSSNFPYGTSPAEDALPDAEKINRLTKDEFDGIEFGVLPVGFINSNVDIDTDKIEPGSLVNYSDLTGGNSPVTFMGTQSDIQSAELIMARLTKQIEECFYIDVFQALRDRQNMSATEVVERANERIQTSMMFKAKLESQFLSKIMNLILFYIRDGKLKSEMIDVDIIPAEEEVRYTYCSLIDTQIKQLNMERTMGAMNAVAQALGSYMQIPSLKHHIDEDAIIRTILDGYNVPYTVRLSRNEKARSRQAEMQQQQAQQEAEMQQQMAGNVDPVEAMEKGML